MLFRSQTFYDNFTEILINFLKITPDSRQDFIALHDALKQGTKDISASIKVLGKNGGITNAEYVVGKAEEVMPRWAKEGLKTDVIFVDPPRKGLTPEFIEAAVETNPKKIVYISCNPATMVRDLQLFKEQGYDFDEIDPVDMFPSLAKL